MAGAGGRSPIEPPRSSWQLPVPADLAADVDGDDLVAVGADLAPGTLLAAYRSGMFPMHVALPAASGDGGDRPAEQVLGWWSPDPRAILPLERLRVSRSLRQSARRFEVTTDRAFADVVAGCAAPHRTQRWINAEIADAYQTLHEMGWAHSVEVWSGDRLVGGLYGVAIGGLFAGESMFHRANDASKVALVHLVELLGHEGHDRLLDVQWATDHLTSLGAVTLPRAAYLERLEAALRMPLPVDLAGERDT